MTKIWAPLEYIASVFELLQLCCMSRSSFFTLSTSDASFNGSHNWYCHIARYRSAIASCSLEHVPPKDQHANFRRSHPTTTQPSFQGERASCPKIQACHMEHNNLDTYGEYCRGGNAKYIYRPPTPHCVNMSKSVGE